MPQDSLWRRSAAWRWLIVAALAFTAAAGVGVSSRHRATQATAASARFDPAKVSIPAAPALLAATGGGSASAVTAGNSGPASGSPAAGASTKGVADPAPIARPVPAAPLQSPASASPLNRQFEGEIEVGGQRIPLPSGKWLGLAFFRGQANTTSGDSVVLGRIMDRRLEGLVAINASTVPAENTGFPLFKPCDRTDYVHLQREINEPFGAQRCWWINHGTALWEQPIMRAARSVLDGHGIAAPPVMVNVAFRRAWGGGFATAFYYFNPEGDGISSQPAKWAESDWHRSRLSNDPRRVEYIRKLIAWGVNWEPKFYSTGSN